MLRRVLDWTFSTLGIISLFPLFLVAAVLIKAQDGGSAIYRAKRVGRGGKVFEVFKFRTMVPSADNGGSPLTSYADPRVTTIGLFLRRWKIDELPQLFNVWRGEMSLVGPRPEDPKYVERYSPEERQLLEVTPGITSPASIRFRDEASLLNGDDWEEVYTAQILPRKLAIEMEYQRNRTLAKDFMTIVKTLGTIWR